MLTIFCIPKPFRGHFETIQRNAIQSWSLLEPTVEIILLGDEPGTREIAKELGLCHIPNISTNEYGTPLVDDIFSKARAGATNDLICYVNADIILMVDFLEAVKRVRHIPRFLMVGRRWDLELDKNPDFKDASWEMNLTELVEEHGTPHECGIDSFVFQKDLFLDIPPFAIGRGYWDNWFVYHARMSGWPVIDASPVMHIVHQAHGELPVWAEALKKEPEHQKNFRLLGGLDRCFDINDANLLLTDDGLRKPRLTLNLLLRRVKTFPELHPILGFWLKPIRYLWHMLRLGKDFREMKRICSG